MEVKLIDVTKRIGEQEIINKINLQITRGSVFSIVGPNGAGKTTIIRMILNLYNTTEGKILVNNVDVSSKEYTSVRNKIGFLLDNIGLFKDLNCWDNLEFFDRIYYPSAKYPERSERIGRLLKKVDLFDKRSDKITFFSRGMKQRLAIARALINEPELLILDEPSRGLDVEGRMLLKEFIQELTGKGCTIIFNSHDLNELQEVCTHVAFLKKGSILHMNTYNELEKAYSDNTYVLKSEDNNQLINKLKDQPFVLSCKIIEEGVFVQLKDETNHLSRWIVSDNVEILEMKKVNNDLKHLYNKIINE
ncbi:ABC transporter ATP-binding protein [Paenibacillus ihuae]|uniref:ABC transporter ATP-binding protein n=1 Tax=Paenibacillus ihuae TaxID=1232431 RepID=UPI0006D5A623|nr:ABC transporter ATP-binding protein [Paenibacillus ihuae]